MSLTISDPVKILTNEMVKLEVSFKIEEEFSKDDAKLTLQCNKEASIGTWFFRHIFNTDTAGEVTN